MFKLFFICIGLLLFSCQDTNKLSEDLKALKDNQNLMMQKQSEVMKQLALLSNKVGKGTTDNSKKNNKRKGPNPDFAHNIPIGNSVVLGNPNASVTVTKFTDFQ